MTTNTVAVDFGLGRPADPISRLTWLVFVVLLLYHLLSLLLIGATSKALLFQIGSR